MGRGRSKAKQTKVARDLKYSNQDMDLENLAKELHGEVKKEKSFDNLSVSVLCVFQTELSIVTTTEQMLLTEGCSYPWKALCEG